MQFIDKFWMSCVCSSIDKIIDKDVQYQVGVGAEFLNKTIKNW